LEPALFSDNNVSTDTNWLDDTAPVSNLASTDLIFGSAATQSTDVVFDAPFSARTITFQNVPGATDGYGITGQALNIGTGGISNNDPKLSAFENLVSFASVTNVTINAASGGLGFANTVTLPSNTLTVTGSHSTEFVNISGTSTLTKSGSGEMFWTPNIAITFDVNVAGGFSPRRRMVRSISSRAATPSP
jgi:hypothetical protein